MNRPTERIILIKGAGEKASAVAHRLHGAGFQSIVMTDLSRPRAERRGVSFCEALLDGRKSVCGVTARKGVPSLEAVQRLWARGEIPVLADPGAAILPILRPDVVIDGVLAKRNTGTAIQDAPLVIALGPGFIAGKDAHAVVETNPMSPDLGAVLPEGGADEDTGVPDSVLGLDAERVIISPGSGTLRSVKEIGDRVEEKEMVGHVNGATVSAPVAGVLWGLMRDGVNVRQGRKIGDIDPRGTRQSCFEITPHAGAIADGVLKALAGSGKP